MIENKRDVSSAVAVTDCAVYDEKTVQLQLQGLLERLGYTQQDFADKRICLKPNLVMAKHPDTAATTHPTVLSALAKLLLAWGAKEIRVIDSPGGPYVGANLGIVYRTCGLHALEEIPGVILNQDFSFRQETLPEGKRLKSCAFLTPVLECDMLINVCKLKTHGLTGLSCAVKNLFGLVPGVEKFSMHATFPKIEEFSEMLVDITEYFRNRVPYLAICDGIVGMEGNGPTHGTPVSSAVLMASASPYAMDVLAEHMIGCQVPVVHLDKAAERGLVERDWKKLQILGEKDTLPSYRFAPPEASSGRFLKNLSGIWGGRLAEIFAAKPKINTAKCLGCGVCERSCPAHTISMQNRKAVIHKKNCIRCYCCQELCPHGAVDIGGNPLIRWIH